MVGCRCLGVWKFRDIVGFKFIGGFWYVRICEVGGVVVVVCKNLEWREVIYEVSGVNFMRDWGGFNGYIEVWD